MSSPKVHHPLTKLMCCPTSDGGACAIVVSEKFVKKNGLEDQAVELLDIGLTTDFAESFTAKSN
jgi:acetyl-CoA acetyltransferase